MKKQFHILILLLILGFFLAPTLSYSCETNTEKSCCKKENTSKTEKKDCCHKKDSKEKDDACGGKCGQPNCTTSTVTFSLITCNEIEFITNIYFDLTVKKSKFHYTKALILSGFTSIWQPPKI